MSIKKEEVERICDRVKYEMLALVCGEATQTQNEQRQAVPDWLTIEELVVYMRLDTKAGIEKWIKRGENPLPHGRVGDLLRFYRTEVDQWMHDEAERTRLKLSERRSRKAAENGPQPSVPAGKRPSLSIAGSKGDGHASL